MAPHCPLAIAAPDPIGTPVATFICRHVRDLLPGGTAVIAPAATANGPAGWTVDGPLLDLRRLTGGRLRWQVTNATTRLVGWKLDAWALRRFLKQHRVQVFMGEYLDFSLQWMDASRPLGLPFFVHSHGHDLWERLEDPSWRAAYARYHDAAGIISNSAAGRDLLVEAGFNARHIHVIPCGVDVPPDPPARPPRPEVRCIAVGRMVEEKAPILLLDAFRRAAAVVPELRLDLIGGGPLLPAVEHFLMAFDLKDRVTVHGELPNPRVLRMLDDSDLFLQHSLREGLGVAILEAMAHALPVVATRAGGIRETVVEGVTGALVDPGDSVTMADHIASLGRDPAGRRRLGAAGWQRVRDHFSWEQERAQLLHVLGLAA
jgi:glycosyltransferase involved in cell wall biosynthesis